RHEPEGGEVEDRAPLIDRGRRARGVAEPASALDRSLDGKRAAPAPLARLAIETKRDELALVVLAFAFVSREEDAIARDAGRRRARWNVDAKSYVLLRAEAERQIASLIERDARSVRSAESWPFEVGERGGGERRDEEWDGEKQHRGRRDARHRSRE